MKIPLIKFRLRGLGPIPDTGWIETNPRLTVLRCADVEQCAWLATAVETINPAYCCDRLRPFADVPTEIQKNGYRRRTHPHKHTIAIGIFSSPPDLIRDLTEINLLFYETDQIEVGRRLDYSRWLNFIELAASTRWQEIKEPILTLLSRQSEPLTMDKEVSKVTERLQPSDRITGDTLHLLAGWLNRLAAEPSRTDKNRIDDLAESVARAEHFAAARRIIKLRLPFILTLDPSQLGSHPIPRAYPAPGAKLPAPLEWLFGRLIEKLHHPGHTNSPGIDQACLMINQLISRHGGTIRVIPDRASATVSFGIDGTKTVSNGCDRQAQLLLLQAYCQLIVALAETLRQTPPILIFIGNHHYYGACSQDDLLSLMRDLSQSCQCLAFLPGSSRSDKSLITST